MKNEETVKLVVYVEDDPGHAELVLRSLEREIDGIDIVHLEDGEAALLYLERQVRSGGRRPWLILLDLRLPKVDGLEVLRQVKADARLRQIPVVILTTSSSSSDISRAYEYSVNSYLVKPDNLDTLDSLMREVRSYWLAWNTLPMGAN